MRRVSAKSGFSLLEALVAVSVAGVMFFSIFELQNRLTQGAIRYNAAIERATISRNALALIKDINPSSDPEGTISLPPNLTLNWTSTELTDEQSNVAFPGIQPGAWNIQLFRVSVEITDAAGAVIQTLSVDRVGYLDPTLVENG